MLKLENSIRGLSFSRVAFDLTIQGIKNKIFEIADRIREKERSKFRNSISTVPRHLV